MQALTRDAATNPEPTTMTDARHIIIQTSDFAFVLVRVDTSANQCSVAARLPAHRGAYRPAWVPQPIVMKGVDDDTIKRAARHTSAQSFRSVDELLASNPGVTPDDHDFAY